MLTVTVASTMPGGDDGVSAVRSKSNRNCSGCFGVAFVAPVARIDDMPDKDGVGEADEVAPASARRRFILSMRFSACTSTVGELPEISVSLSSVAASLAKGFLYASVSGLPRIAVATTLWPARLAGTFVHPSPSHGAVEISFSIARRLLTSSSIAFNSSASSSSLSSLES